MREEMDEKVFLPRQSRHFSFVVNTIKVFFAIFTLTSRLNNCVSR